MPIIYDTKSKQDPDDMRTRQLEAERLYDVEQAQKLGISLEDYLWRSQG